MFNKKTMKSKFHLIVSTGETPQIYCSFENSCGVVIRNISCLLRSLDIVRVKQCNRNDSCWMFGRGIALSLRIHIISSTTYPMQSYAQRKIRSCWGGGGKGSRGRIAKDFYIPSHRRMDFTMKQKGTSRGKGLRKRLSRGKRTRIPGRGSRLIIRGSGMGHSVLINPG